jgi:hypothetical protein
VTQIKNGQYRQLATSRDIQSSPWLPPFRAEQPATWLVQAEAHFALAGISDKRTKFYYISSPLDWMT